MCYIRRRLFSLSQRHILKAQAHRLDVVCLSDCGRVRTLNEDAVAVDAEYGIAVVADGIGGHRGGEVASRMAIDIVVERLRSKVAQWRAGARQPTALQFAEQIIGEANRAIHAAAREQSTGLSQINEAVTQLDTVTQQNVALVEESAAAAQGLKESAVSLGRSVDVFRLG